MDSGAALHDTASGARITPPTLGPSLGLAGWLSRVPACMLAPDDSGFVGLSVSRHGATSLFLVRLDGVAGGQEPRRERDALPEQVTLGFEF